MADRKIATKAEMWRKHPSADSPPELTRTNTSTPQLQFTAKEVQKASLSFRKGSAPGPSGLRPEHLIVALKGAPANRTDKAGAALARLVNLMVRGEVPEEVASFLCGARLHAALKKDGGLRPIAVGNLTRRLASKLVASELAGRASSYLSPHQLGVGTRGGCEAIVHSARQALREDPTCSLLQSDFINTFNQVNRDSAFQEVESVFPECLSWVLSSYSSNSLLQFGDATLTSEAGFHQGDPLASLLFSLVLHPVVKMIQAEVPTLKMNAWFLDDGAQVGTREELQRVVSLLEREGPPRGLHLSTTSTVRPPDSPKTTVWCPTSHDCDSADNLLTSVTKVTEPGTILLGAPLGSESFIKEVLMKRVEKVQRITSMLHHLEDPHTESVLLRSCLALPKLLFSLRTVETTSHKEVLEEYDRVTREGISRIIGVPLTDHQWLQANLPVSMGGLGLRAAEDHAPAAFASSYLTSQPLLRSLLCIPDEDPSEALSPALLDLLTELHGKETTMGSLEGMTQKEMCYETDKVLASHLDQILTDKGEEREKARMASLRLPHSGAWLNVVPSPALGLHLRPSEFSVGLKLRLGIPVFTSSGPCPACRAPSAMTD